MDQLETPVKETFDDPLPNFPEVSKSRMESELNAEYKDLESGYNTAKAERVKRWAEYAFQPYGNEIKGQSQLVDSTIFNSIEWMIPTMIQPFVETDHVAEINPEGSDLSAIITAKVVQQLLTHQIKKKLNFYQLLYDDFKTYLVGGTSFLKLTWMKKDKEKGELASRPIWTHINPDQMRYDWTSKCFEDSHVVTQNEEWTRTEILEWAESGQDGIIKDALKEVLAGRGKNKPDSELRDENADRKTWVGEMNGPRTKSMDLFTRREHWTMYDVDGKGKAVPVLAVFIEDVMVQVIKNPYKFQHPPYSMAECVRDPLGAPAAGFACSLSPIQQFRTAILRMLSDNLNSQNNGLYEVDRTNIDEVGMRLLRFAPQGSRVPIPVRRPGTINPLTPAPMAQHAFTAWEMLAVEGENRSGSTRYSQGLDSNSLNQTATGIVSITQRSEMRMWELTKRYSETSFKRMMRMTISINQQKLDKQDLRMHFDVNIHNKEAQDAAQALGITTGLKADQWVTLSREDIGGYFSVDIDVMVGSDRQSKINNLLNYMQYVVPSMGENLPPEVATYVAMELAELMGLSEIKALYGENYVGTRGVNIPKGLFNQGGGSGGVQPLAGGGGDPVARGAQAPSGPSDLASLIAGASGV